MLVGELFLGIKTILLSLKSFGKDESPSMTSLNVLVIRFKKNLYVVLSSRFGILSGPQAVLIPKPSMILETSALVMGDVRVTPISSLSSMGAVGVCSPRNSSMVMLEDWGLL